MRTFAKAIAAAATALGTWGASAAPEGIEGAEWFGLAGVVAAFALVYAVPNTPDATHNGNGNLEWDDE